MKIVNKKNSLKKVCSLKIYRSNVKMKLFIIPSKKYYSLSLLNFLIIAFSF